MSKHHSPFWRLFVLLTALLLVGCGGGSGDNGNTSMPPEEPEELPDLPVTVSPSSSSANNFRNALGYSPRAVVQGNVLRGNALDMINAHWLYARGDNSENRALGYGKGTGEGVTVGIIDSGLDGDHPNFEGIASLGTYRLHPNSRLAYQVSNSNIPSNRINNLSASESQHPQRRILRYNRVHLIDCDNCDTRDYFRYHDSAPNGLGGTVWKIPTSPYSYRTGGFFGFFQDIHDIPGGTDHGSQVAAVAVGDGVNMHGVAYDADIFFVARPLGELQGIQNADRYSAEFINHIGSQADVINHSYGGGQVSDHSADVIRRSNSFTIAARARNAANPADSIIHVNSAGNNSYSSPGVTAGMVAFIPELQGNNLAVVSVDARNEGGRVYGRISDFSNRCGVAQRWCLAAPGGGVLTEGGYYLDIDGRTGVSRTRVVSSNGTSLAAPYVTGGIAALMSYFNGQLGNEEIVERVLRTANKSGIYANSDIYGQGLLDLDAASRPYGGLRVPTGADLGGVSAALEATRLRSSAAFGDAWQAALAEQYVSAFDELDAPFPVALGGLAVRSAPFRDPREWLELNRPAPTHNQDAYGEWWSFAGKPGHFLSRPAGTGMFFGYGVPGDFAFGSDQTRAASAPYLDLDNTFSFGFGQPGGFQLAAFHGMGESTDHSAYGLTFGWQPSANLRFGTGYMHEEQAVLGSAGDGALQSPHAGTWFAGGDWQRQIGAWQGNVSTWFGMSRPQDTADGLIDYQGPLLTSQLSMSFSREHVFRSRDRFSLVLEQPLRVEQGQATLHYPTGRTRYGDLRTDELTASLSPTGREWQLRTTYRRPIPNGTLEIGAGVSDSPGHVKNADPEPFAALGVSWDF